MKYSKEFKKMQWTKCELHKLLKHYRDIKMECNENLLIDSIARSLGIPAHMLIGK